MKKILMHTTLVNYLKRVGWDESQISSEANRRSDPGPATLRH